MFDSLPLRQPFLRGTPAQVRRLFFFAGKRRAFHTGDVKRFKAIAAISLNRVIGRGNSIPWHLPEDFKWFKQITMGQVIVMGRRTYESIGRPLPGRTTVVLTRSVASLPGVVVAPGLDAIDWEREAREVFICGGAQVYAEALPRCSDLYLTLVKREVEGDVFFPRFEHLFEPKEVVRETPEFRITHYLAKAVPPG